MNVLLLNEIDFKQKFYEKMNELSNIDRNKLNKYILYAYRNDMLTNKNGISKISYDAYNPYDLWLQVDEIYDEYSYEFIQDIMYDMAADIISETYDEDIKNMKHITHSETFDFNMENVVKACVKLFEDNDTFWYIKYE